MHLEEITADDAAWFPRLRGDFLAHDSKTATEWFGPEWADLTLADLAARCATTRRDWRPKAGTTSVTTYLFRAGEEGLGFGRLCFPLSPDLERRGGNLLFTVAPAHRGRGLGTLLLNQLLFEAARAGLARAWVSCDVKDARARACILRNRGELIDTTTSRHNFWINLR